MMIPRKGQLCCSGAAAGLIMPLDNQDRLPLLRKARRSSETVWPCTNNDSIIFFAHLSRELAVFLPKSKAATGTISLRWWP